MHLRIQRQISIESSNRISKQQSCVYKWLRINTWKQAWRSIKYHRKKRYFKNVEIKRRINEWWLLQIEMLGIDNSFHINGNKKHKGNKFWWAASPI